MNNSFWVLCDKPENWEIAVRDGLWGLTPKFGGKWRYLQAGDRLFFYVTNPVGGVIGTGIVQAKFRQNKPLWPDEMARNEVLYPFRFEFDTEYILPREQWRARRAKLHLPIGFYSGMNLLDDQDINDELQITMKQEWGFEIKDSLAGHLAEPDSRTKPLLETSVLSHDKVKDMLFEIGKIRRYISEKEYRINGERLDVVWRRVEKSVPTYAFEIQVGGDLYHALVKLKHAHSIWNSNIYVVADEKYRETIEQLLGSTFHEIGRELNMVTLEQVKHLYSLQAEDARLRTAIGLP